MRSTKIEDPTRTLADIEAEQRAKLSRLADLFAGHKEYARRRTPELPIVCVETGERGTVSEFAARLVVKRAAIKTAAYTGTRAGGYHWRWPHRKPPVYTTTRRTSAVIVDGRRFESQVEAARTFGLDRHQFPYWLKVGRLPDGRTIERAREQEGQAA